MKHPDDKSDKLIGELEKLLKDLKEGGVTDYAIVTVYADRRIGTYWSQTTDKWRLVGATEALKADLMGSGG